MSYDMDKLAAVVEMGEIIRLQNEAVDNLKTFSKSKPYLIAPNIVKMVEENLKENIQLLYKEMNNLHKPPAEVKRHACRECSMVFGSALPGGICDECRSKVSSGGSAYGGAMAAAIQEMQEADATGEEGQNMNEMDKVLVSETDLEESVVEETEVAEDGNQGLELVAEDLESNSAELEEAESTEIATAEELATDPELPPTPDNLPAEIEIEDPPAEPTEQPPISDPPAPTDPGEVVFSATDSKENDTKETLAPKFAQSANADSTKDQNLT